MLLYDPHKLFTLTTIALFIMSTLLLPLDYTLGNPQSALPGIPTAPGPKNVQSQSVPFCEHSPRQGLHLTLGGAKDPVPFWDQIAGA